MGKNTASSYKKLKKIEKSKVKIKTTKTLLPKGQNVTDTNFKVKKIVIRDQVRQQNVEEVLSRKKLSCKELVGRLTHHNMSIKYDSLLLLKQLVTDFPEEILQRNLALLIESVPKLTLDEAKDVRKEANKLLYIILSQSPTSQLMPLFPLMSSYLICGLTHIDSAIREDSLLFLDTLLHWTPKLCSNSIPQLLPICLDLVSSSTSNSRTLTLNLESKLTSAKWRGNVLARISVLLGILRDSQDESRKNEKISIQRNVKVFKDCQQENGKTYLPISLSTVNYDFDTSPLFMKSGSQLTQETQKFDLKGFMESLIPLLFQAFIEMVPVEDNLYEKTSTIISSEVSLVLKHILDILNSCWELLLPSEEEWFKLKFSQSFMNSLITGRFPYSLATNHDGLKKKKEKLFLGSDEISPNCQMQNLMLVKFTLLLLNSSLWSDAIACMKSLFRISDKLLPKECSLLIYCSKIIICSLSGDVTRTFLDKLCKLSRSSNGMLSSQAIHVLYEIAVDSNYSSLLENNSFQSWFEYLPEVLTGPSLTSKIVDIVYDLAKRNIPAFSVSLDGSIEYILDKIPEITVVDSQPGSNEAAQIKIAQLLFWVNDWDDEMVSSLKKAIEKQYWGEHVTSYIKDIFEMKFSNYVPQLRS